MVPSVAARAVCVLTLCVAAASALCRCDASPLDPAALPLLLEAPLLATRTACVRPACGALLNATGAPHVASSVVAWWFDSITFSWINRTINQPLDMDFATIRPRSNPDRCNPARCCCPVNEWNGWFMAMFVGSGSSDMQYNATTRHISVAAAFLTVNATSQACNPPGSLRTLARNVRLYSTYWVSTASNLAFATYPDGSFAFFNFAGVGCSFEGDSGIGPILFGLILGVIVLAILVPSTLVVVCCIRRRNRRRSEAQGYRTLDAPIEDAPMRI